jgi:hypothetical protein
MPSSQPRAFVIRQLFTVVSMAAAAGMFLVEGLENALRGNPSFWSQFVLVGVIVVLLVGVFVVCRRIAQAIP